MNQFFFAVAFGLEVDFLDPSQGRDRQQCDEPHESKQHVPLLVATGWKRLSHELFSD